MENKLLDLGKRAKAVVTQVGTLTTRQKNEILAAVQIALKEHTYYI